MESNIVFAIILMILNKSDQIYVPDEGINQKPITYTSGIKTSYRKPFSIHQNYSRIYHQNSDSYTQHFPVDENDETSERPYPVYNAHTYGVRPFQSERLTQTYVLNGTRIRKNQNPIRQVVKYNKEKRSSKIEIYRTCPTNTTGQFVYEFSCNQFLNCWKGRGHVQNCAPGTLFNPKTLECDFPEKVTCVSGPRQTILQKERKFESIKQVGCPNGFSGLIPNYTDCSKFINCVSGIENLMDCPSGTLFDIDKNICDFAHKAKCFNGQNQKLVEQNIDGKLDFTQNIAHGKSQQLRYRYNEIRCPNDATGLYAHPTDCSKFLNCANGQTYIQTCGPGTLFNPTVKICDFPYNVRCQNSTFGIGVVDYDARYHLQNESWRDTDRTRWNDNKYYGGSNTYGQQNQNSFLQGPYRQGFVDQNYGNRGNNYAGTNYRQNSFDSSINQQEQNRYTKGFGYQQGTSTGRYKFTNGNYGSGLYDNYGETDSSRSTYGGGGTGGYTQNQYQKGSRRYDQGTYGTESASTRPNQNVNGWNYQGSDIHDTSRYDSQHPYDENRGQQGLGSFGDSSDLSRPNQNINGYQQQGSKIYPIYNNENRRKGHIDDIYHQQSSDNWRPNTYHGQQNTGGTYDTSWGSNYAKGSGATMGSTYTGSYWRDETTDSSYNVQPDSEQTGVSWGSGILEQRPINNYNSNSHAWTKGQATYPTNNNHNRKKPFSTRYPEGSTFDQNNAQDIQRNEWQQNNKGEVDQNRWNSRPNRYDFQHQNTLDEDTSTNYDEVVNINQVRKTTPFRNAYEPFFGPTTLRSIVSPIGQSSYNDNSFIPSDHGGTYARATTPPTWKTRVPSASQTNDYDDTFVPAHSSKFVRATTPQYLEKNWPPPFPSTDVNADYVFEDDDDEVTLEAENSPRHYQKTNSCRKNDFRCSNDECISKSFVCNSFNDCPNGEDELKCLDYISKFSMQKNKKLAILEKERWDNVSIATCALLCVESQKFKCRSFNYRKIDKTCFLTNTNEGLTGAIISYYPFDYYELNSEKLNCSNMHVCENKKCIDKRKICDGIDDCGDRMDEKSCKTQDYGYSIKLLGSKNNNEGYVEVTAFGKKGFICDDQFGLRDANVICKELGFSLGAVEVKGNSFFYKNSSGNKPFYMMDDVECIGNETRLMDCDFSGWGVHNCLDQEVAGVVCKTPLEKCASDYWQCDTGQECLPLAFVCDGLLDCTDGSDEGSQHCDAPTQIRLVNGTKRLEGRVEIRHHGIWGTVCDDDFNEDAAKVICKQLGYRGSAVVKKDAYFGSGSGPIWLDQVFCSGNETNIEDCSHWNWGEHNCEHSEDVGVICSNTYEYEERHQSVVSTVIPQTYPDRCGYRNDNIFDRDDDVHFRVIKGSIAKKGDYPWQAAIRVKGKTTTTHWCGAVIISQKFVLTAAHCLIGYPKGAYVVVAGDYNVDESEGTEQEFYIDDYYLHEDFRQGHKMNNDIGLVKLKGHGFHLGGDVQAICLPDANTSYETDQNCTISGFGSIESGKSAFSHNLRAGWVPLQKREICTMPHVYGNALTEGMICAGSLDEGVDACDGDSGGPLACLNNGLFTLYGITSWGQHCGYANKPGVYVKVAHYRKWIDDNIKKYSVS